MPATTSAVFLQIDNSYGINSKSPSTQSIQSIRPVRIVNPITRKKRTMSTSILSGDMVLYINGRCRVMERTPFLMEIQRAHLSLCRLCLFFGSGFACLRRLFGSACLCRLCRLCFCCCFSLRCLVGCRFFRTGFCCGCLPFCRFFVSLLFD